MSNVATPEKEKIAKPKIIKLDCLACGEYCNHHIVSKINDEDLCDMTTTCTKCGKTEKQ